MEKSGLKKGVILSILWMYLCISLILFLLTSHGWALLLYITTVNTSILIIAGIISSVIIVISKRFNLVKKQVPIMIALQIIAILFNYGDCGDEKGGFSFFERVLGFNNAELCLPPYLNSIFINGTTEGAALISTLLYSISIIWLVKISSKK